MRPVKVHTGLANQTHEVMGGIYLSKTVVWSGSENKPVLCLTFSGTSDPSVGVEAVRVLISLGVVGRWVDRRDDHRALGNSVGIGNREVFLSNVRDHDDRWAVTKTFLDNSTSIGHAFQHIHGQRSVAITVAQSVVLLTNFVENLGTVGHDLEQPGASRTGSILRSKQESEHSLGDLIVGKVTKKRSRLFGVVHRNTLGNLLAICSRFHLKLDPAIHDTSDFTTSGKISLALGSTFSELDHDHISGLLSIPGLGEGNDNGKVDKLESGSNQKVVVGDLLDGFVVHVVSNKGLARNGSHELSEFGHELNRLEVILAGHFNPLLEVLVVDFILTREVQRKSVTGEKAVQAFAEFDMGLAVQEDPVGGAQELVSGVHDAGFDKGGRVEDLAREIAAGRDHDEPARFRLSNGPR